MGAGLAFEVQEVGIFTPKAAGRSRALRRRGRLRHRRDQGPPRHEDRRHDDRSGAPDAPRPFPAFMDVKPMVFASLFPIESDDYENLRDAMEKLRLNDASFTFEPESSTALGFGFRCGYLGLLHMEIVQERLEREFNLSLVTTAPSVPYEVVTTRGDTLDDLEPGEAPGAAAHRRDPRALHPRDDHHEGRVPRRAPRPRGGAAGKAGLAGVRRHGPGGPQVRISR